MLQTVKRNMKIWIEPLANLLSHQYNKKFIFFTSRKHLEDLSGWILSRKKSRSAPVRSWVHKINVFQSRAKSMCSLTLHYLFSPLIVQFFARGYNRFATPQSNFAKSKATSALSKFPKPVTEFTTRLPRKEQLEETVQSFTGCLPCRLSYPPIPFPFPPRPLYFSLCLSFLYWESPSLTIAFPEINCILLSHSSAILRSLKRKKKRKEKRRKGKCTSNVNRTRRFIRRLYSSGKEMIVSRVSKIMQKLKKVRSICITSENNHKLVIRVWIKSYFTLKCKHSHDDIKWCFNNIL